MTKKQEYILSGIILLLVGIRLFCLPLFFETKIKKNNITFYGSDELKEYSGLNQIFDDIEKNPFFNPQKKVSIYLCDSHLKYSILNPLYKNSIGATLCIGPYRTIICNKTDFVKNTCTGSETGYNTRSINQVINHEMTHVFLTKGASALNRFFYKTWVEEGIAEYLSQSSTFDVTNGVRNILNDIDDKRNSFRYLKYRVCAAYLINVENKNIDEILSEKRNVSEIIKQVKKFNEDQILEWLE